MSNVNQSGTRGTYPKRRKYQVSVYSMLCGKPDLNLNQQPLAIRSSQKICKTGNELCWYKMTAQQIDEFLKMAQNHEVISKEGIDYLTRKIYSFKFSVRHETRTVTITNIAKIFSLIAEYQELSSLTIRELSEIIMNPDYNDDSYDSAKEYLLKAIENYCDGGGEIDPEIQIRLSHLKDSPSCTVQMSKSIWRILSNYDDYLASTFEDAFDKI